MAKPKMKNCKVCGEEIARSAKVCPKCGAKNRISIGKMIFGIIAAAIALIMLIGFLGGDSEAPADPSKITSTTEPVQRSYLSVDMTTMIDDLRNNALGAKDKYLNQYVSVAGELSTIDSSGAYISIDIPSAGIEYMFDSIHCRIRTDDVRQQVMNMRTGDLIVVKGKITDVGEILGYSIDIDAFG